MLLDSGPHVVSVELAVKGADRYNGMKVTYAAPVAVRCMVQPLKTEEAIGLGIPDTSYKVITRSWPGGIRSRLTWNGRVFYQHGETKRHGVSPRTAHDSAVMVSDRAEVK